MSSSIDIICLEPEAEAEALALSELLGLPLTFPADCSGDPPPDIWLEVSVGEVRLRLAGWSPRTGVSLDFGAGRAGYRHARAAHEERLLIRAVGLDRRKALTLLDGTAGLGTDALILASLGCRVVALEQHPLLAYLLVQAFSRWQGECAAEHVQLCFQQADTRQWLRSRQAPVADVVYLDPMFPQRRKTAQVKKEMQLLQVLVGPDVGGDDELLDLSLARAGYRVVVKRPRQAPFLGGRAPDLQITGKAVRFDVYTLRSFRK